MGETPVPIPNTTVKTLAADGTVLVTARESRRLPDTSFRESLKPCAVEARTRASLLAGAFERDGIGRSPR